MKNLFPVLFAFLFSHFGAQAQTRFGNVRCDSFLVTVDTSRAVIYRKKKTGVFDQKTNKFLIKPTKDVLFYFDEVDYFLRIGKKEITPIYIQKNGGFQRMENSNPDTLMLDFPHVGLLVLKDVVKIQNRFLYNHETQEVVNDEFSEENFRIETEIGAYRKGNLLYLKNSQFPYADLNRFDIPSIIDTGYTKSGVYDLEARNWVVPPIYESCYWEDDFIFCLKREVHRMNEFNYQVEQDYRYDIYKIGDEGMTLVLQDIYKDEQIEISEIFGCDSVSVTGDNSYYTTWKNGKQGLVKFSLFREFDMWTAKPEFICQKIMDEKYDFVLLGLDYGFVMTYDKTAEKPIVAYTRVETDKRVRLNQVATAKNELVWGTLGTSGLYAQEAEYLFNDNKNFIHILADSSDLSKGKIWVEDELEETIESDMDEAYFSKGAGLRVLDDKYLQVVHFRYDSLDLFAEPLATVNGEDSIFYDEESGFMVVAYPGPIPGYYNSGVYDYSVNNWFVAPNYGLIRRNDKGFLLESFEIDEVNGMALSNLYSFKDNSGNLLFQNEIPTGLETHFNLVLNTNETDQIVEFPEKVAPIEKEGVFGKYYYVQNNDGSWQVYQPLPNFHYANAGPLTKPKSFVHYNAYYDYYFWLEKDSIYLEMSGSIHSVSRENGRIRLLIQDIEQVVDYAVQSIEGNDTSIYTSYMFENENNLAEIYIYEDKLILNENQVYDNISIYEEYFDGYEYELDNDGNYVRFQTETSAVWEKKDGVWRKQTPYYAYVEPIPFGYIVTTGDYEEIIDIFSHETIDTKGRTLILDENYKAISFLDFYDFKWAYRYDEGIMICLEQGCFFVNNSGKVITGAEWSDFEIEDGKLKAIKYNEMDEDWWWEDPEEMIEKVEYFDLE